MKAMLIFTFCLLTPCLFAQEGGNKPAPSMDAMEKAAALAPEHKILAKMVGDWKSVTKMWMDPAGEPLVSEGTSHAEAILGGRFIMMNDKGVMMGKPFEGLAILGYDTHKKAFTLAWRSSEETSVTLGEGTYDEATKTIGYKGTMFYAMMNAEIAYRFETQFVDADHFTDRMFMTIGDQEMKVMVIESTRVK